MTEQPTQQEIMDELELLESDALGLIADARTVPGADARWLRKAEVSVRKALRDIRRALA